MTESSSRSRSIVRTVTRPWSPVTRPWSAVCGLVLRPADRELASVFGPEAGGDVRVEPDVVDRAAGDAHEDAAADRERDGRLDQHLPLARHAQRDEAPQARRARSTRSRAPAGPRASPAGSRRTGREAGSPAASAAQSRSAGGNSSTGSRSTVSSEPPPSKRVQESRAGWLPSVLSEPQREVGQVAVNHARAGR